MKERADKKNSEWAAREAKQQQDLEKEENSKKKLKKVVVKKTDKEGWVTENVTLVDSITGEPEKPAKPEKLEKSKKEEKKLQAKAKTQQQVTQEVSHASLASNPFALTLEEHAYESRTETQSKKNFQKNKGNLAKDRIDASETQKETSKISQKQAQQKPDTTKQTNTTKQKPATKQPKAAKPASTQQKPTNPQQKEVPTKKSEEKPTENKKKQKTEEKEDSKPVDQKKIKKIVRQSKSKGIFEHEWVQPIAILLVISVVGSLSYFFVFS